MPRHHLTGELLQQAAVTPTGLTWSTVQVVTCPPSRENGHRIKISELADRTAFSADTLRYYERIGLIPPPARDGAGHRHYDESDLVWVAFLERLKTTGMPIRDRLRYAELRQEGDHTATERRSILADHRADVRERINDLTDCLEVLDRKIETYDETTETHDD